MDDKKYDSIIFDLDGTLWDALEAIRTSWNEKLAVRKDIKRGEITEQELGKCMGLTMYNIAANLFPEEKESVQRQLMDEMCDYELEYLQQKGGNLYDNLKQTLLLLKKKYKLYIVSNCQDGYIQTFIKAHNMEGIFDDIECWGRTGLSKGENNRVIMKRNNLANPVYVGDTAKDAQSAVDAQIDFIYAAYGFGEVDYSKFKYVAKIEKFQDLLSILD